MKQVAMGGLMGLMMIWMIHGWMTGDNGLAGWALLGFVGAHVAIVVVALKLGAWVSRRSPRLQRVFSHSPSMHHLSLMIAGIFASGTIVHLTMHGGVV